MMLAVAAGLLASCHTATQKEEREFVGNWLEVMPVNSQFTQGVTLNADGTAASIGMATLKYESWSLADGKLVLNGKSIGNGQTLDFSDTLDVVSLTADSLKLGKHGAYRIDYYRVKEVPDSIVARCQPLHARASSTISPSTTTSIAATACSERASPTWRLRTGRTRPTSSADASTLCVAMP